MSGAFNAYHVWLGIPPNEQPPNHYRLLGIAIFEADLDVIDHAADRQMAHVRTFQSGRHGPLSQQILNELSAARLCLLTAEKKAIYDEQLRSKFGVAKVAAIPVGKAVSVVKPVAVPKAAAIPAAIPLAKPRPGGANSSSRVAVGPTADPIALDFDPMTDRSAPSVQLRMSRRYRRANRWHREIATAIVTAAKEVSFNVPLVVRLEGTNVERGRQILTESGIRLTAAKDLTEAAEKAVAVARA